MHHEREHPDEQTPIAAALADRTALSEREVCAAGDVLLAAYEAEQDA